MIGSGAKTRSTAGRVRASAIYPTILRLEIVVEDGLFGDWRVSQMVCFGVYEARMRSWWCDNLPVVRRQIERRILIHRDMIERSAAISGKSFVNVCATPSSALALAGLGTAIATELKRTAAICTESTAGIGLEIQIFPAKAAAIRQLEFAWPPLPDSTAAVIRENVVRLPSRQERLALKTSLAAAFADDPRLFKLASDLFSSGVRTVGDLRKMPKDSLRRLVSSDMSYLRLEMRLLELAIES